jgi:hypothetical protein
LKGDRILNPKPLFYALPLTSLFVAVACSSEPGPPASGSGGAGGSSGSAPTGVGVGGASVLPSTGGSGAGGSGAPTSGGGGQSSNAGTSAGGSAGSALGGAPSGGSAASGGTGGSGAGGTSVAGSAGSGTGGGALSGCMGVTSKFCDDFEMQAIGQKPTGDFSVDDGIVVDTSKAYSGTKAIHLTTAKPTDSTMLRFSKQFPMNDFHGRAMLYLTRIPMAGIHWDLIDTTSDNNVHWEIGGMYGKFILVVDPPDHGLTSNPFPTGKWFCLQWQFKYGGQGMDNTFVAKMDGTVLDKGQFTGADSEGDKWNAGPWKNLQLGWVAYGNSDVDIELWIDDLALGDQPIACPGPKP